MGNYVETNGIKLHYLERPGDGPTLLLAPGLAAGAHFPAALLRKLRPFEHDPEGFAAAGIDYATDQCNQLLAHRIAGLHFYTLNKSTATLEISRRLGLV